MEIKSYTTNKTVDKVCKEIEKMIRVVLNTNPNKRKECNKVSYYPARRYLDTDDMMDNLEIVVRKVNNTTTSIKLNYEEFPSDNWRKFAMDSAFNRIDNALYDLFK